MAAGLRRLLLLLLLLLLLVAEAPLGLRASSDSEPPFEALYAAGLEAHWRADFAEAARGLERALSAERRLREKRAGCGLRCRREEPLEPGRDPLPLAGALLRRARCLRACLGPAAAASASAAGQEVRADFQRRLPYSYLQRAYIQLNELDKAADAAHTFFAANPEHLEIQQDLDNYKTLSGKENLVDREAQPHMENYLSGIRHYDREEYDLAIGLLEQALKDYAAADAECRILCEGPQRFEEYEYLDYKAVLYEAIADHSMQVLLCQHECVRQLATRPGRLSPIDNFLPLHYDFLQFAYFRVGDYVQALECTRTYLLFHPDDEDVLENEDYYKSLLEGSFDLEAVKPREEAVTFLRRHRLEADLLEAGANILGFLYTEPDYWNAAGTRQETQRDPSGLQDHQANEPGDALPEQDLSKMGHPPREGPLLFNEVQFVYNSQQLNGTQRVLLDNVISPSECQELEHIANNILLAGDGYRGKTSPHTPNEKFEGATILNALKFGYEGRIPLKSARLFYDVSEKARKIVESYFMLNSTLYFSYTHLVCRTALSGQQERRNDLSHPIHADNCLLDPEANECWKEPPAYTFRDYSALLYMNSDFEGGEFIFTEMDAKTVTASIQPKCGRMVSFSSGGENPHGVKAVTRGQRCAVALWFTLNPLYRELERIHADEIIALLDHQRFGPTDLGINPKDEL
ncbi:prolyl 3-hydroxylase 2 isoform X1 [Ahaetulla prasina]|uniref:prolyl 3-hydroxylase 2 isoform X1 n=1 Tax=Ahaetulla prasina TaxID=499056 RepID=UPI00264A023D|nr:prolyl 3-hydroxylase 2 isoform X1 [Ahaetulla prasina]